MYIYILLPYLYISAWHVFKLIIVSFRQNPDRVAILNCSFSKQSPRRHLVNTQYFMLLICRRREGLICKKWAALYRTCLLIPNNKNIKYHQHRRQVNVNVVVDLVTDQQGWEDFNVVLFKRSKNTLKRFIEIPQFYPFEPQFLNFKPLVLLLLWGSTPYL